MPALWDLKSITNKIKMPARTWRSRHVRFLFASRARAATPAARGAARFMMRMMMMMMVVMVQMRTWCQVVVKMMRIFIILMILTRLMMENLVFKSFIYFGYTVKHNFLKIYIYSDLMPMCLCANWCKALKVATGRPEIQVLVIVVFKSNIIMKRNST